MAEPRYTPKDFENSRFAAVKNFDRTITYFFRPHLGTDDIWISEYKAEYTIESLIEEDAFPVFAEPYSPESFRFAWEHAEVPSLEEVESSDDAFLGVAMTLNRDGSFTIDSGGDLEYFTPRDRFLYRSPTLTRSQRIYELLSEEAPHLESSKLSQLAQAVVEFDDEILDILGDR